MNRHHSAYPGEGTVVSGQSKVEKAKYVHSENNLRRTLENIGESFKRTNKRLSDETETLRSELHKLRQSIEKVRQEKEKRMTGEYHNKRRPYQAERFLCDKNIVTVKPFSGCSPKFVSNMHIKSGTKKQCQRRLAPIKLHQNKPKCINDEERLVYTKEQPSKSTQAAPCKLPKLETPLYTIDEGIATTVLPAVRETSTNKLSLRNEIKTSRLQKHFSIQDEFPCSYSYLEVPRIPICDLKDIKESRSNALQSKPHFLPPLDKITEGEIVELKSSLVENNGRLGDKLE